MTTPGIGASLLLYPLWRWWAELKQRRNGWLGYL
jgi:hypothetical protein